MSRPPHAYPMPPDEPSTSRSIDASGTIETSAPGSIERSIRSRVGPEAIASVLLVAVIGLAAIVLGPSVGAGAEPGSSPSPSPGASVGTVATPTPSATTRPWMAAARTVLTSDERLIVLRDELAAAVAAQPAQADVIARIVRSVNVSLRAAGDAVDAAGAAGLPPAITARARDLHGSALTLGTSVLDAAIGNTRAYVEGGRALVAALEGIEASMAEVARVSGLPVPAQAP